MKNYMIYRHLNPDNFIPFLLLYNSKYRYFCTQIKQVYGFK